MSKKNAGLVTIENAKIRLVGESAVCKYIIYTDRVQLFIGSLESDILIYDFRPASIKSVEKISKDQADSHSFANVFNRNGKIVVNQKGRGGILLEVQIFPVSKDLPKPSNTLITGVIWNESFPWDVEWERFFPITINKKEVIACCALVHPDN